MANEARVFAEGPDSAVVVRQFTVADGTAVAKGALLIDGGATRTAVAHTAGSTLAPLGFATSSKVASDGRTEIGLQRTGVVDAVADGAIRTGDLLMPGDTTANRLQTAPSGLTSVYSGAHRILGRALENAADGGTFKAALTLG